MITFEAVKFKNILREENNWYNIVFRRYEFLSIQVNGINFKRTSSNRYYFPFNAVYIKGLTGDDLFYMVPEKYQRIFFLSIPYQDEFDNYIKRLTNFRAILSLNTADHIFGFSSNIAPDNYIQSIRKIKIPIKDITNQFILNNILPFRIDC